MGSKFPDVSVALFLLLTLVSAVVIEAQGRRRSWIDLPHTAGLFEARNGGYWTLQERLRNWVNKSGEYQVRAHPVFHVEQLQSQPPMWLFEEVFGWPMDNHTVLALRSDGLGLAGFTNSFRNASLRWYSFKGQEHLVPNSTPLGFDGSYASLLGDGGWRGLHGLRIGRAALLEAIRTLANYDPATTSERDLKDALAKVLVMLCEAARFPHVRGVVARAWEDGGELDLRSARLVGNWRRLSCAVLIWNMDGLRWDSDEANELADPEDGLGIYSVEEALGNVGPLMQPRDCSVQYWT